MAGLQCNKRKQVRPLMPLLSYTSGHGDAKRKGLKRARQQKQTNQSSKCVFRVQKRKCGKVEITKIVLQNVFHQYFELVGEERRNEKSPPEESSPLINRTDSVPSRWEPSWEGNA